MTERRLAKLTFTLALTAVASLTLAGLWATPAEATPPCPPIDCSGDYRIVGTCSYYDPDTNCTFSCKVGQPQVGFGFCRTGCQIR